MKKVSFLGDILVCIMLLITTTAAITFAWFSSFESGESNIITTGTFIIKLNNEEVITQTKVMPEVRFNASTLYTEASDTSSGDIFPSERDEHFNELVTSFSFKIENAGSLTFAVSLDVQINTGASDKQPQLHYLFLPEQFNLADNSLIDVATAIESGDYKSLISQYLRSSHSGAEIGVDTPINSSNEWTLISNSNNKYQQDMIAKGGIELAPNETLNVYCLVWVCGYNCTHTKDAATGECGYSCGHRHEALGADVNFQGMTLTATVSANQVDGGYEKDTNGRRI